MPDPNVDYYEENAESFRRDTVNVDMTELYRPFLALLPASAAILDAGCGSGRDARAFLDLGYRVTAFDASPTLSRLASEHIERPVFCMRFQDLTWKQEFDGIWASASLLHVQTDELVPVLHRLCNALKPGGVLYASFKLGRGEREFRGRRFTDLDESGLAALVNNPIGLNVLRNWTTSDKRPGREAERWLNVLLTKPEATCSDS